MYNYRNKAYRMKGYGIIVDSKRLKIGLRNHNKHTSLKVTKKQANVSIHKYFLPQSIHSV